MTKIFKVEFEVEIGNAGEMESNITLERFIARQLSVSLMLKDLNIDVVKIDSHKYNIEGMRKRRYRDCLRK